MQLITNKHLHPFARTFSCLRHVSHPVQTFPNEKQQKYVNLVYVTKNLLFYRPFSFVPYLRRENNKHEKMEINYMKTNICRTRRNRYPTRYG